MVHESAGKIWTFFLNEKIWSILPQGNAFPWGKIDQKSIFDRFNTRSASAGIRPPKSKLFDTDGTPEKCGRMSSRTQINHVLYYEGTCFPFLSIMLLIFASSGNLNENFTKCLILNLLSGFQRIPKIWKHYFWFFLEKTYCWILDLKFGRLYAKKTDPELILRSGFGNLSPKMASLIFKPVFLNTGSAS